MAALAALDGDARAVATARLLADRAVAEVAASLRDGLDYITSDYTHSRTRGLLSLAATVRRFSGNDAHISALRHLLHGRLEVDMLSLMLGISLVPQEDIAGGYLLQTDASISGGGEGAIMMADTAERLRQPSETEAQAATLLLRGLCIVDPATRRAAGALGAVEMLLKRAQAAPSGSPGRCGALEALAAVLVECPDNQAEFTRHRGASLVAAMLRGDTASAGGTAEDPGAWAFLVDALCRGVLDNEAARAAEGALGVELAARIIRDAR